MFSFLLRGSIGEYFAPRPHPEEEYKVLLRSGKFDDVLNLIRESGVTIDHNKFVYDGLAPLHIASAAGALELVVELLSQHADVLLPSSTDNRPLHYASKNNHKAVVDVLMRSGADPSIPNSEGLIPVELTTRSDIVNILMPSLELINKPSRFDVDLVGVKADIILSKVIDINLPSSKPIRSMKDTFIASLQDTNSPYLSHHIHESKGKIGEMHSDDNISLYMMQTSDGVNGNTNNSHDSHLHLPHSSSSSWPVQSTSIHRHTQSSNDHDILFPFSSVPHSVTSSWLPPLPSLPSLSPVPVTTVHDQTPSRGGAEEGTIKGEGTGGGGLSQSDNSVPSSFFPSNSISFQNISPIYPSPSVMVPPQTIIAVDKKSDVTATMLSYEESVPCEMGNTDLGAIIACSISPSSELHKGENICSGIKAKPKRRSTYHEALQSGDVEHTSNSPRSRSPRLRKSLNRLSISTRDDSESDAYNLHLPMQHIDSETPSKYANSPLIKNLPLAINSHKKQTYSSKNERKRRFSIPSGHPAIRLSSTSSSSNSKYHVVSASASASASISAVGGGSDFQSLQRSEGLSHKDVSQKHETSPKISSMATDSSMTGYGLPMPSAQSQDETSDVCQGGDNASETSPLRLQSIWEITGDNYSSDDGAFNKRVGDKAKLPKPSQAVINDSKMGSKSALDLKVITASKLSPYSPSKSTQLTSPSSSTLVSSLARQHVNVRPVQDSNIASASSSTPTSSASEDEMYSHYYRHPESTTSLIREAPSTLISSTVGYSSSSAKDMPNGNKVDSTGLHCQENDEYILPPPVASANRQTPPFYIPTFPTPDDKVTDHSAHKSIPVSNASKSTTPQVTISTSTNSLPKSGKTSIQSKAKSNISPHRNVLHISPVVPIDSPYIANNKRLQNVMGGKSGIQFPHESYPLFESSYNTQSGGVDDSFTSDDVDGVVLNDEYYDHYNTSCYSILEEEERKVAVEDTNQNTTPNEAPAEHNDSSKELTRAETIEDLEQQHILDCVYNAALSTARAYKTCDSMFEQRHVTFSLCVKFDEKKFEQFKLFLEYLPDLAYCRSSGSHLSSTIHDGATPLHCAAKWNNVAMISFLLRLEGVDVWDRDLQGRTPLHLAAANVSLESCELLLNRMEEVGIPWLLPLKSTAGKGGSDVQVESSSQACESRAFSPAVRHASMSSIRSSFQSDAVFTKPVGVNAPVDLCGLTPLGWAVKEGKGKPTEALRCLLFADGDRSVLPLGTPFRHRSGKAMATPPCSRSQSKLSAIKSVNRGLQSVGKCNLRYIQEDVSELNDTSYASTSRLNQSGVGNSNECDEVDDNDQSIEIEVHVDSDTIIYAKSETQGWRPTMEDKFIVSTDYIRVVDEDMDGVDRKGVYAEGGEDYANAKAVGTVACNIFGVLDGHGGDHTSSHFSNEIPERLNKQIREYFYRKQSHNMKTQAVDINEHHEEIANLIQQSISDMDAEFSRTPRMKVTRNPKTNRVACSDHSGTTLCAVVTINDYIYACNLGDSRVVIASQNDHLRANPSTCMIEDRFLYSTDGFDDIIVSRYHSGVCKDNSAIVYGDLSFDHKCYYEEEKNRVESAGSLVFEREGATGVWAIQRTAAEKKLSLAVSRALGDFYLKVQTVGDRKKKYEDTMKAKSASDGTSSDLKPVEDELPSKMNNSEKCVVVEDVGVVDPNSVLLPCGEQPVSNQATINVLHRHWSDLFLVIACDGVWDCMPSEEVISFLAKQLGYCSDEQQHTTHDYAANASDTEYMRSLCAKSCDLLIEECFKRGSNDNMSVILVMFSTPAQAHQYKVEFEQKRKSRDRQRQSEIPSVDAKRMESMNYAFASPTTLHGNQYIETIHVISSACTGEPISVDIDCLPAGRSTINISEKKRDGTEESIESEEGGEGGGERDGDGNADQQRMELTGPNDSPIKALKLFE